MADPAELTLAESAALEPAVVLTRVGSRPGGLSVVDARERLTKVGPNSLATDGVSLFEVLFRQLKSFLLLLLIVAAVVSAVVGDVTEAVIISVIIAMSVGLSFLNEFRSEKAIEALHSQIRHFAFVERDGASQQVSVSELVPGDVVHLKTGDVVPADLRLLECHSLECDESILTGESEAAPKRADAVLAGDSPLDLPSCSFMGTVVRSGGAIGVVLATGRRTAFGEIASRLGKRHDQTSFQRGLQAFSRMLAGVTLTLAGSIFLINVAFGRSVLQSGLFALAIAVGLTPQLLPAIVTVSLATGARRLAQQRVVVKRLVSIEDLGNVDVLFTDKTGTLTEGHVAFQRAIDLVGHPSAAVLELGLATSEKGGNDLDQALWESAGSAPERAAWPVVDALPFDHERQLASTLVDTATGRHLVMKGAPEAVLARCEEAEATTLLDELFASGIRVVAVASREAAGLAALTPADEKDMTLAGFLCFADPPKASAAESLARLNRLGVTVKIITGDNGRVAEHVCAELGVEVEGVLTGAELAALDDAGLLAALPRTTLFARVTPEQKSRVIRAQRSLGSDVGFLGDGVNDAIALHDANVGISVDSGSDVAKDAADVVLLDKDLGILADGVMEGRRIFANTIKYVLMGTSSNFGNMFSAAGASLFLSFLPMLPTQILLNNLLYDVSELTIPTDSVDEEMLARPNQWDIHFIRRFMAFFGPISSLYDFLTFAVMLWVFDAHASLFRSGWFVESLATQTLVIFVIRTRRVPFFRSRPSRPLLFATVGCALVGVAIPYSPLAHVLGFRALPATFLVVLVAMIATYLALAEIGKHVFFRSARLRPSIGRPLAAVPSYPEHQQRHRAIRFGWGHRAVKGSRSARAR